MGLIADGIAGAGSYSPPPARLVAEYPRRELARGEVLYRAGGRAETLFRVEEGLLKLSIDLPAGRERIVDLAGPGDLIGAINPLEAAFVESAQTLSQQAGVRMLPRRGLPPELADELMAAAGARLRGLRQALEDGELPVPARLARALARLGRRFGQLGEDGVVRLTLPLTHDNLAAMVGAARETTTAGIGELRAAGVLSGTRGRYSFRLQELGDFEALAA